MSLTAIDLAQSIKRKIQYESARIHGHEVHQEPTSDNQILSHERLGREIIGRPDFVENGLEQGKVDMNRRLYGTNQIELPPMPSYYSLVCEGLEDPTLRILLVSAVVSLLLGFSKPKGHSGIEGISVLLSVSVVVNVQALTNYNKSREFRKQQEELENRKSISVIRDRQIIALHPRHLVVGDLVRAKVGTVIPADGVLVSGELWMDESALTGESRLISKAIDSICVSGTSVMKGEGLVLIAAVGEHSISGKILSAIVAEHTEGSDSVLFKKLDKLAMDVGRVGMGCSLFVFLTLLLTWGYSCHSSTHAHNPACQTTTWQDSLSTVLDFFITAVTVLVVAVPEGLPLAVTLALAVALGRLLKDRNQVKRFESCETMGSATTICSDKTGTLTENRMKVVQQSSLPEQNQEFVKDLMIKCFSLAVSPDSKITLKKPLVPNPGAEDPGLPSAPQEFTYEGNPTECGLLRYCMTVLSVDYTGIQQQYVDHEANGLRWGSYLNPFSSERKMMSVVIQNQPAVNNGEKNNGGRKNKSTYTLLAKGAPSILLQRSNTYFHETTGQVTPLTEKVRAKILDDFNHEENLARRVLAFAVRLNLSQKTAKEEDLTFLGWVSLEDPLRDHIVESVKACKRAGVIVRMITGDSLPTARAIGKQCGILSDEDASSPLAVMTGAEFDERVHKKDPQGVKVVRRHYDFSTKQDTVALAEPFLLTANGKKVLDDSAFDEIWPSLRILARCEPEDKLTLVKGLRTSRLHLRNSSIAPQVVAVTGDGTNDAPSLKAADIGFAMGIAGTDVAKQAADVIVLDDSFNSIVRALVWGRNVHDSVCKFLQFQMTVNLSAVILTSVGSLFLMKSPMTSTQMLWVNMIMDSLGSLALATMNPDENLLLSRPPIPKHNPVISLRMVVNIVGQAVLQLSYLLYFLFATQERNAHFYTMVFNTFVMFQFVNELNCKSVNGGWKERFRFTDYMFVSVWIGTLFIQVLIVQNLGVVFTCVPLSLMDWVQCVGIGLLGVPWQIFVVDPIATLVEKFVREKPQLSEITDEFEEEETVEIDIQHSESTPLLRSKNEALGEDGVGGHYDALKSASSSRSLRVSTARIQDDFESTSPKRSREAKRRWALVRNTVMFAHAVQASSNSRRSAAAAATAQSATGTLEPNLPKQDSLAAISIDGSGGGGGSSITPSTLDAGDSTPLQHSRRVPVVKRLIHSMSNRSLRGLNDTNS